MFYDATYIIARIIIRYSDKKLMIWEVYPQDVDGEVGIAKKSLTGHSQTVQDVTMSFDGLFALSGSWGESHLII